jgi:hypothetical protein
MSAVPADILTLSLASLRAPFARAEERCAE